MNDLEHRIVLWHQNKFPRATPWQVLAKAMEELGEVAEVLNALSGDNSAHPERAVVEKLFEESADVAIVLVVLIGRYFQQSLTDHMVEKIGYMDDPHSTHATNRNRGR